MCVSHPVDLTKTIRETDCICNASSMANAMRAARQMQSALTRSAFGGLGSPEKGGPIVEKETSKREHLMTVLKRGGSVAVKAAALFKFVYWLYELVTTS